MAQNPKLVDVGSWFFLAADLQASGSTFLSESVVALGQGTTGRSSQVSFSQASDLRNQGLLGIEDPILPDICQDPQDPHFEKILTFSSQ